ncbi:MAG TPA: ANTAR domain-containing protein [Acidiphilium sp.]|uniref:ANTAR domain-containing response regulator n=1 Tax=Acidiphilium sp. TaxID=527 RepID=UPI002590494F|nr:ANTAR domain-containing protein [Acidiphilium sp.]HQT89778.1 ANTAR domain-containing protein [Acidiphilium sp.]
MTDLRILRDLRELRVLLAHPHDGDGDELLRQLRRIGCQVHHAWPPPPARNDQFDVVFFLVEHASANVSDSRYDDTGLTRIAVVNAESPLSLRALMDARVHAVIMKPIRPIGILTNLVLGRSLQTYESRLISKVTKLEETMKSQRLIARATRIIMARECLSEDEAYGLLRRQAMKKRVSMASIAEALTKAEALLEGLRKVPETGR